MNIQTGETLRVAFVGKGGSGKSTIAGTFARLLGRTGQSVLAIDSDPVPGMPYSLGIPVDDRPIPDTAVVAGSETQRSWILRDDLGASGVIDRYTARCPDHVRYLQFGNLWGPIGTLDKAQHAWVQTIEDMDRTRWHMIGDLPGGTRDALSGWGSYATTVLIVVEPSAKSVGVARRLHNLSKATWAPRRIGVVANRVSSTDDVEWLREQMEATVVGAIPRDPIVTSADRAGVAPLDADGAEPFVSAVSALLECVVQEN